MLNMLQIENKRLSRILYGVDNVLFKVFFDDALNIKSLVSSKGSNDFILLTHKEREDLRDFVKDDVVMTATEFTLLRHVNKVERC